MKRRTQSTTFALMLALAMGCAHEATDEAAMNRGIGTQITNVPWGAVDGRDVRLWTLDAGRGVVVRITNYGAIVTSVLVPDRDGASADVVLGFDDLDGYRAGNPYFGCIAGRCANRIAHGRFSIDGTEIQLATNNGPHHLHGGNAGFDKAVWSDVAELTNRGEPRLRLFLTSADGDEGYPGRLDVEVSYTLTFENELVVDMKAEGDRATPVNLVHHSYWNLAGHDSGSVLDHELALACGRYTPADAGLIPTGELAAVEGTVFDFRSNRRIGADIEALRLEAARGAGHGGGYDVNLVVDGEPRMARHVARLRDPRSGRTLTIEADQPGLQFYTGNFLDGSHRGKGGAIYRQYQGLCLESQNFPNAVNTPNFPDAVLRPGAVYRHRMTHRFSN